VLAITGYVLLDEWRKFADSTNNIDLYVVIAAAAIIIGYLYWTKRRARTDGE
jgi:membrane protein DedA with SNARE-associated domain